MEVIEFGNPRFPFELDLKCPHKLKKMSPDIEIENERPEIVITIGTLRIYCAKLVTHILFKQLFITGHNFFPAVWQISNTNSEEHLFFSGNPTIDPFFAVFI